MTLPSENLTIGTRRSRRIYSKLQEHAVEYATSSDKNPNVQQDASPVKKVESSNGSRNSESSRDLKDMMEILHQLIQNYDGHVDGNMDKDECLTCPIHLSRPSFCTGQNCPPPLSGPKLSKPELLEAQALDDIIVLDELHHKLVDIFQPISKPSDANTIRTILVPILHEKLWSVLILSYGDCYISCQYHEPRINGRAPVDLAPYLREAVKATFGHFGNRNGSKSSWDRFLTRQFSVKCKSMNRTSKTGACILELLADWFSQELKLPKASRATETGKTWAERFEHLELLQLGTQSLTQDVVSEDESPISQADQGNQDECDEDTDSFDEASNGMEAGIFADEAQIDISDYMKDGDVIEQTMNDSDPYKYHSSDEMLCQENVELSFDSDGDDSDAFIESDGYDSDDIVDSDGDDSIELDESETNEFYEEFEQENAGMEQNKPSKDARVTEMMEKLEKDQIGMSSSSGDPHQHALRILGEEYLGTMRLTQAQCDEILRLRGRRPCLDEFSEEDQDLIKQSMMSFRQRLDEILQRISRYACRTLGRKGYYCPLLRPWHIANGLPGTRELVLDFLTDPRITPYQSQIARGRESWNIEIFRQAQTIEYHSHVDRGDAWGVYTMDISLPHGSGDNRNKSLSFRYTGSSISGYDASGLMGVRSRIFNGHERKIDQLLGLEPDEVAEYRSQGFASFVHEIASYPGAKRTYYRTMVFPAVEEATLLQSQVKQLVLFCETAVMLYVDSFDRLFATPGSRSGLARRLSCAQIDSLRPAHMPRPSWLGTNRSLPFAGKSVAIASVEMKNDRLPEILTAIYDRKGSTYLTTEDIEHVKAEYSRLNPSTIWPYARYQIRKRFKGALIQRGIITTSSSIKESILRVLPIFAVVKEYMYTKINICCFQK